MRRFREATDCGERAQAGLHHSIQTAEPLEPRRMLAVITASSEAGFTIFSGVGATNAAAALKAFQTAVGGVDNGNVAAEQPNGSRRINWDGVLLDGTDFMGKTKTIIANKTVGIPVNRFQTRGALFGEVYAVSGDGFASANPGVAGQLNFFSPKNIFGHFNDIDIDTSFIKPSAATTTPVQQATRGFGAIFLDVEQAHSSYLEFHNGTDSLGQFFVPPGASGQPEFLGVLFKRSIVTEVEASPGTSPLFFFHNGHVASGEADISKGGTEDMAAVDDFVYAEPAAPVHPTLIHATEGSRFTGTVARFTTTTSGAHASNFTATINWGDNHTTTGTVAASGTAFVVNGSHTFAEEGTFPVSISIKDNAGHTATGNAVADVADAALHATAVSYNATTADPFKGTVATLTDSDSAETDPTTYSVLIDWGDGSSSVGSLLLLSPGHWAVRGTHQYTQTGTFTFKVLINDVGGSTTTASGSAHVI